MTRIEALLVGIERAVSAGDEAREVRLRAQLRREGRRHRPTSGERQARLLMRLLPESGTTGLQAHDGPEGCKVQKQWGPRRRECDARSCDWWKGWQAGRAGGRSA